MTEDFSERSTVAYGADAGPKFNDLPPDHVYHGRLGKPGADDAKRYVQTEDGCLITGRGMPMLTISGRHFYPLDPRAGEVELSVIGHALGRVQRFGGHTTMPYSVATHSVLVMEIVRVLHDVGVDVARQALLHDATEAYIGDMIRPLKKQLPAIEAIEARIWAAVAAKFEVPVAMDPRVIEADNIALHMEKMVLLHPEAREADWGLPDIPDRLHQCFVVPRSETSTEATRSFFRAANELGLEGCIFPAFNPYGT